jgi:hypothetical protein
MLLMPSMPMPMPMPTPIPMMPTLSNRSSMVYSQSLQTSTHVVVCAVV